MIRHVVLVKFREGVASAEIDAIFAELADLRKVLTGMLAFSAGPNISPEGLSRGFGHAFRCDFKDVAARDAYLDHPAHRAAGGHLVALAEGGVDGLLVLDFTMTSAVAIHRHGG